MQSANIWSVRGQVLNLEKPLIMGILNVTPDSFSDGGRHAGIAEALRWAETMRKDGADIIDVGGESTRPGADAVEEAEEVRRVVPVVEALVQEGYVVSVDTSKARVMAESLSAGAHIINDIRAFREEGAVDAVATSGAGLVIMHMQGQPRTMQSNPHYDDLLGEVEAFLREREEVLVQAGASVDQICWDQGFGFGKTVEQNFELLAATERFVASGRPLLVGLSRKSSIGAVTGVKEADKRIVGSVAAHLMAVERGAQIVRVHDVKETKEALAVWEALRATEGRL